MTKSRQTALYTLGDLWVCNPCEMSHRPLDSTRPGSGEPESFGERRLDHWPERDGVLGTTSPCLTPQTTEGRQPPCQRSIAPASTDRRSPPSRWSPGGSTRTYAAGLLGDQAGSSG